jgi:hypothetical protein
LLEKEFGARNDKDFGARRDFLKLGQHEVCAKLADDYVTTFWTNPPLWEDSKRRYGRGKEIINWSRNAYGKPRAAVETEIAQLWGDTPDDGEEISTARSPARGRRATHHPAV